MSPSGTARPDPAVDEGSTRRPMGRWPLTVAGVATLVALCVGVIALMVVGSPREPVEHRFVVPAGTGAALDRGEAVAILPASVQLRVRDRLVIENLDDRTHLVGPFSVRAGETLVHEFSRPGRFVGACSIHPSGEVEIVVTG